MATRREFLLRGTAGLAGAFLSTWIPDLGFASELLGSSPLGSVPILQGWATDTETEFKILRPVLLRYHYQVVDSRGIEKTLRIAEEFEFPSSPSFAITHLTVGGLAPGENYFLRVSDDEQILDEREFGTRDLGSLRARIALLSCMHDRFDESQASMWAALERENADLMLFIGDACYADYRSDHTPPDIWRRHCETRLALNVFRWKRLVPSLAVWDDHDYGLDNADETFPYKTDSLRIFKAFFGSLLNGARADGPGASQVAYAYGMRLSLMDDRFFRSPAGTNGTHWGDEQEAFLQNHLRNANLPTLLCNGSQFHGGYLRAESYEGDYPRSFARLQSMLSRSESPVLFCSGDVHFSEIMEIEKKALGYSTWELTSSAVHSHTIPGHQWRRHNPRRQVSTGHYNFIVVDTEADPRTAELAFRARSVGANRTHFEFANRLRRA